METRKEGRRSNQFLQQTKSGILTRDHKESAKYIAPHLKIWEMGSILNGRARLKSEKGG